jgi:pilus assembly protein CpaE
MAKAPPRQDDGFQVLLVCPNRTIKGELTRLFSQKLPSATVRDQLSYPTRNTLAEWLSAKPRVCFLEVASDPEKAISLIAEMAAMAPSMLIVSVFSGNDPDLILKCLRQGAAEFLAAPFTDEQFLHVLERISRLQPDTLQGSESSGRVYCVISAKGSCGSSTIAANLAYQCKRSGSKRVLLADLDPLTGIISFLLKTPSKYSFLDVLSRAHDGLDADIWKGIISSVQGIDLLLSPENPIDAQSDLHDGSPIVSFSRHFYDSVILDAHSAYGAWSVSLAKCSDELLLVTGNDLASLQSAQRVLAYLERNNVDSSKVRLVVNRFAPEGLSRHVIETALHCDVCQIIPEDPDAIHRAIVEGKPIGYGTACGKSLKELADKLSGRKQEEPAKKPSSLAGFLSMFSRSSS